MNGGVENGNEGKVQSLWEIESTLVKALGRAQSACMCTRGDGAEGEQANEAALMAVSRSCGARGPSCDDNGDRVLDCRPDTGLKKGGRAKPGRARQSLWARGLWQMA